MSKKKKPLKERFEKYVNKTDNCWLWTGCLSDKGYGRIRINGKTIVAHRVSYNLYKGEILNGLWVLHKCDNPPCVNPDHLFLGTHQDNVKDMDKKGRRVSSVGESCHAAKLTEKEVLEIRKKYKKCKPGRNNKIPCYSMRKLAKEYGVYIGTIGKIISKTKWKHI